MNNELRMYLIDKCIIGNPVYYEEIAKQLNLNLALDKDRSVLSKTLGEISAYEYKNNRPLISSIAIYKTRNDHGNGFYKLCEEIGVGKASKLKNEEFGFKALNESIMFWNQTDNYSSYYDIKKTYDYPFIKAENISYFKEWASKIYDKDDLDHVLAKNYLMDTVWNKTQFWSNEVVKRLESYNTSNGRYWSKRGYKSAAFKEYTWARIFKKGNKNKDIYFTIGIEADSDCLLYKLDYQKVRDSNLSNEQKEMCKKYIPESISRKIIHVSELNNWDWEKLIDTTVQFIVENSHHYDQLIKLVWGKIDPSIVFQKSLTLQDFPDDGFETLPKLKPSFKGHTEDFISKNIRNKEIGDAGEILVMEFEIEKLIEKGKTELSEKVKIVEDGKGYDILSYDDDGNEVYIEVKTTKSRKKTPFHYSINERLFAEQNIGKYQIYRLYNFNDTLSNADYFIIKNPEEELLFQPMDFKIYLKKINR